MRSGESDPHDGTSALMRKDIRARAPVPLPYGDTTRRGLSASQEESPQQKWPCWYLISDFQLPELWENPCLLFKPPRLWGFVTAAQVNEDTPLDLQHLARISSKCKNGLEGVRSRCSPSSEWSLSGPSAKGHPNTGRWGAGSQDWSFSVQGTRGRSFSNRHAPFTQQMGHKQGQRFGGRWAMCVETPSSFWSEKPTSRRRS